MNKNKISGFTLVEIAVVLVIVGIILGGMLQGFSAQREVAKLNEDKLQLSSVKKSLLAFAAVNYYLPCPDTDSDGLENRDGNNYCSDDEGDLPYQTLGLPSKDAYGSQYYYAVNTDADSSDILDRCHSASYFANAGDSSSTNTATCTVPVTPPATPISSPPYFVLATPPVGATTTINGNLIVCNDTASNCNNGTAATGLLAEFVPLVVVAYGKNGLQTRSNCNNAGSLERENCDGDRYFHQASSSDDFDDQISWISAYELKQTLLDVGQDLTP